MTMPPAVDPATGLPVVPAAPPALPTQLPPGITIQTAPPAPTAPPEGLMTRAEVEELLGKVRQEEKDKLYPQLSQLSVFQNQVAELTTERDTRLAAETEQQRLAAEAAEQQRLAEQTALEGLAEQTAQTNRALEELRQENARERALREKEAEFAQVEAYRYQRLQDEADNIAPQLVDFVRGGTREAVDASIEQVKIKTGEIMAEVQAAGLQTRRLAAPGVSGAPPVDPMQQLGGQTVELSPEDIRNMSAEDYAANRPAILAAASQRVAAGGYSA